jgi:hypothetical protein
LDRPSPRNFPTLDIEDRRRGTGDGRTVDLPVKSKDQRLVETDLDAVLLHKPFDIKIGFPLTGGQQQGTRYHNAYYYSHADLEASDSNKSVISTIDNEGVKDGFRKGGGKRDIKKRDR